MGTSLSVLAFLLLTADTFARVPAQTHSDAITPQVARGKELWEQSNCMGCHTLFGEGAYYAPELTRVMERRGDAFVRSMLRDPAAMYPGERRMQNYHFSDAQIDDLVAFLTWAGRVDLNGFPPRPVLAATASPSSSSTSPVIAGTQRPRVFNQICVACHAVDGRGGAVGPALDGIGDRRDGEFLKRWLHDPAAMKPGTRMPRLPLSDAQVDELATYLSGLHAQGATTP